MTDDDTPETPVDPPGRKIFEAKAGLNRLDRDQLDEEAQQALDDAFDAIERLAELL